MKIDYLSQSRGSVTVQIPELSLQFAVCIYLTSDWLSFTTNNIPEIILVYSDLYNESVAANKHVAQTQFQWDIMD